MRTTLSWLCLLFTAFFASGCIHVSMDPIQVHAVVDVNVKMEQAVTNLLSDIYGESKTVNTSQLSNP